MLFLKRILFRMSDVCELGKQSINSLLLRAMESNGESPSQIVSVSIDGKIATWNDLQLVLNRMSSHGPFVPFKVETESTCYRSVEHPQYNEHNGVAHSPRQQVI